MRDEFEESLRRALRPPAVDSGFARRVAQRVEAQQHQTRRRRRLLIVALAAGVLAFSGAAIHQRSVERRNLEAKEQLLLALRVTGRELKRAQTVVLKGDEP